MIRTQTHKQRKDQVKALEENSHLQPKESGFRRNQYLDAALLPSITARKQMSVVSATSLQYFVRQTKQNNIISFSEILFFQSVASYFLHHFFTIFSHPVVYFFSISSTMIHEDREQPHLSLSLFLKLIYFLMEG